MIAKLSDALSPVRLEIPYPPKLSDALSPVRLEIPYPPSANHLWRSVPGKGVLLSRGGRAYYAAVAAVVLLAGRPTAPPGRRLRVTLEAFPPDRRRRDLDNLLKACLDSVKKAGTIEDDSLIDDLHLVRREVVAGGRVLLTIEAIIQ